MAFSMKLLVLHALFLLLLIFQLSATAHGGGGEKLSNAKSEFQRLLNRSGFPTGLFPENVKSFTFNAMETYSSFAVELTGICVSPVFGETVDMALYMPNITGKIDSGKIYDISGAYAAIDKKPYDPFTAVTVKAECDGGDGGETLVFVVVQHRLHDKTVEVPAAEFAGVRRCLPLLDHLSLASFKNDIQNNV